MNPRRLYYFLRVASFLFQTKTAELFAYVRNDANFVPKLVKNLSSVHILQLILNMLKLEDQMRELAVIDCEWSGVCIRSLCLIVLVYRISVHYRENPPRRANRQLRYSRKAVIRARQFVHYQFSSNEIRFGHRKWCYREHIGKLGEEQNYVWRGYQTPWWSRIF